MALVAYAPASTGNVSVGFDVLGAALAPIDGTLLGDRVLIELGESDYSLKNAGRFAHKLPEDGKQNIVYDCYLAYKELLAEHGQQIKPVAMVLEKNLPIGSGLGSSASSIVAALYALNAFHDEFLNEQDLLALMGKLEGQISGSIHYDNVAPSHLGGMQLMLETQGIISQRIPHFDSWYWVIAYPGITISTAQARSILPAQYRMQDVLAYGRNLSGFVHASYSGQADLAASLLKDVIAEPYRQQLIPGFAQTRDYGAQCGALASGISGSGPTVFAVCDNLEQAERMQHWLNEHFIQNEDGFSHICKLDAEGTRIVGSNL